ncbi:MAG TPA: cobalamin-dependent protein [Ignavibacteria bacterium]|nr:cobalamin-dependent protein [Ignavibacteria bacterium]
MNYTLSSKKAAIYFNVNESTVKRWADSGILKCFKTSGGHRKFKLEDLKKYAEENNFQTNDLLFINKETGNKTAIKKKNYSLLIKKFEKYILKGDSKNTFTFLYTLYINGYSLAEIFDDIVKVTMQNIGKKWEDKTLNIESEHIATNTIISSLHQFERVIEIKTPNKKTAVCTGLESEFHEIGLLCVKIALEGDGWNVIYPGTNLPYNSIIELIEDHKPNIVCLSSTYIPDYEKNSKMLNEIEAVCENSGVSLILGGKNKITEKMKSPICGSISELKRHLKNLENENKK